MPAVTDPVGSFALPAELYAHDISQYCPSQDYPTVRSILDDAKPMDGESAYLLCHRPVHETGAGYGDGFNLGYELGCVSVALSNLLREVSGGWETGKFAEAGITKEMVRDARKALSDARDSWGVQRAEQCARGFVCVELARYCVDGTIALRLVCACGCSHEPRRLFYGVTTFDATEADQRLAANLERWAVRLTGTWTDHRYETNWFGTTRRAPVAPRCIHTAPLSSSPARRALSPRSSSHPKEKPWTQATSCAWPWTSPVTPSITSASSSAS